MGESLTWERARRANGDETVSWKVDAEQNLTAGFSLTAGRFDWDTCLALGQAAGNPWMLTPSGLFRIERPRFNVELSTERSPIVIDQVPRWGWWIARGAGKRWTSPLGLRPDMEEGCASVGRNDEVVGAVLGHGKDLEASD